jgi:hypothetical protein
MKKIWIIVAFGAGYILGARAGRRRYEQIREKAQEFWNDDRVQSTVRQAEDAAGALGDRAATAIKDGASAAVKKVRS